MASYPTYNPAELVGGISCPTWRDLQGLAPEGKCGDDMTDEIKLLKADGNAPVPEAAQPGHSRARTRRPPPSSWPVLVRRAQARASARPRPPSPTPATCASARATSNGCLKTQRRRDPARLRDLRKALTVSSDVYYYMVGADVLGRPRAPRRERLAGRRRRPRLRHQDRHRPAGRDRRACCPPPRARPTSPPASSRPTPAYYDNDPAIAKDAGRWNTGFSADMAIGQKLNATPLQTANAYASLANGGKLLQPTVLEKITAAGQPDADPQAVRDQGHPHHRLGHRPRLACSAASRAWSTRPARTTRGTAVTTFEGFPFGVDAARRQDRHGPDRQGQARQRAARQLACSSPSPSAASRRGPPAPCSSTPAPAACAAAPAVRMVLEPIADGCINQFQIPLGGAIDAEQAAESSANIGTSATD